MAPTEAELLRLWPVPGPSLSQYTAARWPGASPESTAAVRKYLQRDYDEHHGYLHSAVFFYRELFLTDTPGCSTTPPEVLTTTHPSIYS